MSDELPKGRIARGYALMKLAATELPSVAGRLLRNNEQPMDVAVLKASAERALRTLGELRGLAMKVGQTVSYVDGLLPPEATEIYQKTLAALQSQAPTVSFAELKAEIERGLGRPLAEAYVRFDEAPLAAASIGQVHRAAIVDPDGSGREIEVVVKVQYPSIAHALNSDLKNLDSLRPMVAMLAPGADTRGGFEEVIKHIAAELDYTLELDNQERFRGLVADLPGMMVPRPYESHTGKNVLTMDYVQGRTLRDVAEHGSQALRDRVGQAIFRFTLGMAMGRGVFNTDPHPGNYLVTDDGTVAFLDFGSVKVLPEALYRQWRDVAMLLVTGRHDEWRSRSSELFGMEQMDPEVRRLHQDNMLATAAMVARDEEVTIDRAMLRDAVRGGVKTAREIGKTAGWIPSRSKTIAIPPDFVMVGRMQVGLFAVLAQLQPRANWNRILREMLETAPA